MLKRLAVPWAKKGGLKYQVTIWVDRLEVLLALENKIMITISRIMHCLPPRGDSCARLFRSGLSTEIV